MDFSRRKGGTLKKNKTKSSGDLLHPSSSSNNQINNISVNDMFGKQSPGNLSSPVIDMGSSFTRVDSDMFIAGENPIFSTAEQADELFSMNNNNNPIPPPRPKRFTFPSLGSFSKKNSSE